LGTWAAARVWPLLNRPTRWLVAGMGLAGIFSVFCSYVLVDVARLAIAAALQPSRMLVFTVLFTSLACGLAALDALTRRRRWEALAWFAVVATLPVNALVVNGGRPSSSEESRDSVIELAAWAEQN